MPGAIALAGNQNCGKTTLFNRLTGAGRRVGNFPGVTVELGEGTLPGGIRLVDLPGVYSLESFSGDERVTGEFIKSGRATAVAAVLDAGSPERGLFLVTQLMELGLPMILVLNMADELRRAGGRADAQKLSSALGMPVYPVSALRGEGLDRLRQGLALLWQGRVPPPARLYLGSPAERYAYIQKLASGCFFRPADTPAGRRTRAIDRLAAGRATAYPVFLLIMAAVFFATFRLGGALAELCSAGMGALGARLRLLLEGAGVSETLCSLAVDGAFTGVSAVLGFLPVLGVLFLLLSLLEDSGYMARVAFIMDRPMCSLGLSGSSFVPMLLGFGCTVPAVAATRTIRDGGQRRLTALLIPFFCCSAKIPVLAVLAAAFMGSSSAAAMGLLYAGSLAAGAAAAPLLARLCRCRGDSPFLMELPPYRLPSMRSVLLLMRDRVYEFAKRAFGVILISSLAVWAFGRLQVGQGSLMELASGALLPLFRPLGIESPAVCSSLVAGLFAKEAVLSTLAVQLGCGEGALVPALKALLTPDAGAALLTFTLLYSPCAAALAAQGRELGRGWAAVCFLFQCSAAYLAALLVRLLVLLL